MKDPPDEEDEEAEEEVDEDEENDTLPPDPAVKIGHAVLALGLGTLIGLGGCHMAGTVIVALAVIGMKSGIKKDLAEIAAILAILGIFGLLAKPCVVMVYEAARRSQESNKLKQMALASHNDHDTYGGMYAPFAHDKKGAVTDAGLSFRVNLLPYMEQKGLYDQFDLTQSWDSPRNRPYSDTPVSHYLFPGTKGTATPYRAFVGGGALFNDDGKPVKLSEITDGTSNTILYVHATEQVPWASPRELPYRPDLPLPPLGTERIQLGFQVAMADGSVRLVSRSVSETTLRAAITRAGGEKLGPDW
jgi:hypothetical protein